MGIWALMSLPAGRRRNQKQRGESDRRRPGVYGAAEIERESLRDRERKSPGFWSKLGLRNVSPVPSPGRSCWIRECAFSNETDEALFAEVTKVAVF